ncbi:hypothetical protein ABID29_000478 [Streptococcus rupicaprae]|uniref:Uncharacterized protein n=1 Tax=Streptococcus rupicaprae TaxID=759619 RepID=A0ABV2FFR5_9STRE
MPLTYQLSDAQHARVLSESKQDYTLGFSDGHTERFSKSRPQEAYHVGM